MKKINILSLIFVLCCAFFAGLFLTATNSYADDPDPLLLYAYDETGDLINGHKNIEEEDTYIYIPYQLSFCSDLSLLLDNGDYSDLNIEVTLLDESGIALPYVIDNNYQFSGLMYELEGEDYYPDFPVYNNARKITSLKPGLTEFVYIPDSGQMYFKADYSMLLSFTYRVNVTVTLDGEVSPRNYVTEADFNRRLWNPVIKDYNPTIRQADVKDNSYYLSNLNTPIIFEGITISVDDVIVEVNVDYFNPNATSFVTYRCELSETENLFNEFVMITVEADPFFELDIKLYNNLTDSIVETSPYSFGQIEYNNALEFLIASNAYTIGLQFDGTNEIGLETELTENTIDYQSKTYYIYRVILTSNYFIGDFDFELSGLLDSYQSLPLYLNIEYITNENPQINLISETISFSRSETLVNIEAGIKTYIRSITDLDNHTYILAEILDLVNLSHSITAGVSNTYPVTLSFVSLITGRTGTAIINVTIINYLPVVQQPTVLNGVDDIINNASVPGGTTLTGTVSATDADGDTFIFDIDIIEGINIAEINFNSSTGDFTIIAKAGKIGRVTISIIAIDSLNGESIPKIFSFVYADVTKPEIIFSDINENSLNSSNTLQLNKSSTPVNLRNLIVSVSDDYDALLTINAVSITRVTTNFIITEDQAIFSSSGIFVVAYVLTDASNNSQTINITITVSNRTPNANNITLANLSYAIQHTIILEGSDPDGDAITFNPKIEPGGGILFTDEFDAQISPAPISFPPIIFLDNKIFVTSNSFIGTVKFSYYVTDGAANSEYATITLTFVDNIAPVISRVTGASAPPTTFIVNNSEGYNREGYFTANDAIDEKDLILTITGEVNFNIVNTYTLTYKFTDKSGNFVIDSVIITVQARQLPRVNLKSNSAEIRPGASFDIYDFIRSITNLEGGDITSNFEQSGKLNIIYPNNWPDNFNEEGTYTIRIQAIDDDGSASAFREFVLIVKEDKSGEMWMMILLIGGGALIVIIAIIVISIVIRKRKMRI